MQDLPTEWGDIVQNYRGYRTRVLAFPGGQTQCDLQSSAARLWAQDEPYHTFDAPELLVTTGQPVQSTDHFLCASDNLEIDAGASLDYEVPASIHKQAFDHPELRWETCFTKGETSVTQLEARAQLTDQKQKVADDRSLFFAGLFVGILGGVVIELINTGFEIAERRSADRHSEHDEPPEPTPDSREEPYDPGPRGYL
jgi:hypothetical protein